MAGATHTFFGKKKLSVEQAFGYISKQSILTFFESMNSYPYNYGFTNTTWSGDRKDIFTQFIQTLKNATNKKSAGLMGGPYNLSLLTTDKPEAAFPMYTIFDFIGWAFSAANPVPDDANEDNFYLPLTAIYSKFCRIVAAAYDQESESQPHVTTLAHFQLSDKKGYVILGATIGHPRDTKNNIQEGRKKVLVEHGVISDTEKKVEKWDYGFCAESWFFNYIHAHSSDAKEIYGVSLNIDTYEKANAKLQNTIQYDEKKFKASIVKPCRNCRNIIGKLGFTEAQFEERSSTEEEASTEGGEAS